MALRGGVCRRASFTESLPCGHARDTGDAGVLILQASTVKEDLRSLLSLAGTNPEHHVIRLNADRGTQYTSKEFDKYCKKNNIRRSLGKAGICYDNAVSESFFATYKKELIHTRPWPDLRSLKQLSIDWFENYYNTIRRHSTLGYLTPREYELRFREIHELAA